MWLSRQRTFSLSLLSSIFIIPQFVKSYKYVETFPDPNFCQPSIETLKYGTWMSYGCPITALCVPADASYCPDLTGTSLTCNFCSCEYDEDMLQLGSNQKCVPSNETYAYAAYMIFLVVANGALAIPLAVVLIIAFRSRTQKFDFINISGILACISMILQAGHRALRVPMLLDAGKTLSTQQYSAIRTAGQVLLSISYCSILAMLFVIGVGVHSFLRKSTNLRAVNVEKLKVKIGRAAVGSVLALVGGDMILISFSQFALAFCFSATFLLIAFLLYRRILNRVLGMQRFSVTSVTSVTSQNSMRSGSQQKSSQCVASDEILIRIRVLSLQILFILPLDCAVCIGYTLLWYVGRVQKSKIMLSSGKATVSALHFALLTAGCYCVAAFVFRIAWVRKNHLNFTTQRAIESEYRKSMKMMMVTSTTNIQVEPHSTSITAPTCASPSMNAVRAIWNKTENDNISDPELETTSTNVSDIKKIIANVPGLNEP
eukprot:c17513_g1_i1.p1 GENE.c17513_g1_i1~~c17513_g1_i1.p1  ORF type:complete len:487 (+),score=76.81 c17513_g1_i1:113-1573(+)